MFHVRVVLALQKCGTTHDSKVMTPILLYPYLLFFGRVWVPYHILPKIKYVVATRAMGVQQHGRKKCW